MPKTRINCPNCRQPISADINQLFDVGQDPRLKQIVMSGAFNIAQCPHCGYQGNLATPIVYHDPDKELLLTYFPIELSIPVNEQERIIGPLINQVMNNLPQEKRKAYLLRPQTMFTLQGLVERVLEADGITKEMIQEQQKRLSFLQRLLEASDESLAAMIEAEDAILDASFFTLLSRLGEAAVASGNQSSAQRLAHVQEALLTHSTYGKQIRSQNSEVEAAVKTLQEAGDGLTREKLLDIFSTAPTESRLSILVSLTRPGVDYEFFQILTQRIDQASGEDKQKLLDLREKLLDITRAVDQAMEARSVQAKERLAKILQAENVTQALQDNLERIDDFFIQAMNDALQAAQKSGDLDKLAKLHEIEALLQSASQPPQEYALIEELLGAESEAAQRQILEAHKEEITPEFMETFGNLMAQMQNQQQDQALVEHLEKIYKMALRFSMQMNM